MQSLSGYRCHWMACGLFGQVCPQVAPAIFEKIYRAWNFIYATDTGAGRRIELSGEEYVSLIHDINIIRIMPIWYFWSSGRKQSDDGLFNLCLSYHNFETPENMMGYVWINQLYTEIGQGICDGSPKPGCSRFDELYTWL